MAKNGETEDARKATSVEKEIERGEKDDVFEGHPRYEKKRQKWRHCEDKLAKKPKKKASANGDCCEKKREKIDRIARGQMVVKIEKPCDIPKSEIIPRHCLTKEEHVALLATPPPRCPVEGIFVDAVRRARPASLRIKELAKPTRHKMLMTLQEAGARGYKLPPSFVDNIIKSLEGEACLTPEQAEKTFRKKKRPEERKKGTKVDRVKTRRAPRKVITTAASVFDKDAVTCQYLLAEAFVKSILDWKSPIPKEEFQDISNVLMKRMKLTLDYTDCTDYTDYTAFEDGDRKIQQMRFLSDAVASWISGILLEVAETHKRKLARYCQRKRRQLQQEAEEEEAEEEEEEEILLRKMDGYDGDGDGDEDEDDEEQRRAEEEREEEREEEGRKEAERKRKATGEKRETPPKAGKPGKPGKSGKPVKEGEEEIVVIEEEVRLEEEEEEEEEEAEVTVDEEAERLRLQEEERERQEEEAERLRLEEEERKRREEEEEAEAERVRLEAKEAERLRLEEEEAERLRLEAEEAERLRVEAEEAERQRSEAEEAERLRSEAEEEAERLKLEEEEEERKKQEEEAEAERLRLEEEEEEERKKQEEEAKRLRPEEEEKEKVEEEVVETPIEAGEPAPVTEVLEEKVEEKVADMRKELEKLPPKTLEALSDLFGTDLPFVTVAKIIQVMYDLVEAAPENTGEDPMTDRLHRSIFDKFANIVEAETPDVLTDNFEDAMDVVCGKMARWLRNVLRESQVLLMERYPAEVESGELRDWSRWLSYVTDTAAQWSVWLRKVIAEADNLRHSELTRAEWKDWTSAVHTGALLWRRFRLQTVHRAHHNLTVLTDRQVVQTGRKKILTYPLHIPQSTAEKLLRTTDLDK